MTKRPETIGDRVVEELRKRKRSLQWLADEMTERAAPGPGITRSAISQWGRKIKPRTPTNDHVRLAALVLGVDFLYLLLGEEGQRPRRPFVPPRRVR